MKELSQILLAVAVIFLGIGATNMGTMLTQTRSDIVFVVCNQSRVNNEISETECNRLQHKWSREFLCEANNKLESNHCWVETK